MLDERSFATITDNVIGSIAETGDLDHALAISGNGPYLEDSDLWPDVHLNLILGTEPRPQLDAELAAWADELLRSKGIR